MRHAPLLLAALPLACAPVALPASVATAPPTQRFADPPLPAAAFTDPQ